MARMEKLVEEAFASLGGEVEPEVKWKPLSIRFPREDMKRLEAVAKTLRVPPSILARMWIIERLAQEEKREG